MVSEQVRSCSPRRPLGPMLAVGGSPEHLGNLGRPGLRSAVARASRRVRRKISGIDCGSPRRSPEEVLVRSPLAPRWWRRPFAETPVVTSSPIIRAGPGPASGWGSTLLVPACGSAWGT